MKASKFLYALMFFFGSFNLNAQFFEGAGNSITNLGYKIGDFSYIVAGSNYALADFLSIGLGIEYALADELEVPFSIEFRGTFHAGYLMDLKKSDIQFGYHNDLSGSQGIHGIYQYAISDFFGFYGRSNVYFTRPDEFNQVHDQSNLSFEFGIMFRTMGVGNYGGF